jgi:hypothetical protein
VSFNEGLCQRYRFSRFRFASSHGISPLSVVTYCLAHIVSRVFTVLPARNMPGHGSTASPAELRPAHVRKVAEGIRQISSV